MGDAYIWKDSVDSDTYLLGVKSSVKTADGKDKYMAWVSLFEDAISDLFGGDFVKLVMAMPPRTPKRIQLEVKVYTDWF